MNKEVTAYIESAPAEQREIMTIIRDIIHREVKNVVEEFKWSRPIFKSTSNFAYFQSNKNHISVGFTKDIEKLQDPDHLLEGSGKTMRHLKVKKAADIDIERITAWIIAITAEEAP